MMATGWEELDRVRRAMNATAGQLERFDLWTRCAAGCRDLFEQHARLLDTGGDPALAEALHEIQASDEALVETIAEVIGE
jgi:hypothetical protein